MSPVQNIIGDALGGAAELAGKDEKVKMSTLLRAEGIPEKDVPIMLGISNAESSQNADAVGDGGASIGYFQIYTTVWRGKIPGAPDELTKLKVWLKVPANNVKAAAHVYKSQGLTAWSVYKNGSYKRHLGKDFDVTTDENSPLGGVVGETKDLAVNTAKAGLAVPGFLLKLAQYLFDPGTYVRFVKGAGGAMFVVVGGVTVVTVLVIKSSKSSVGKAAIAVAPTPLKAAKVVKKVVT